MDQPSTASTDILQCKTSPDSNVGATLALERDAVGPKGEAAVRVCSGREARRNTLLLAFPNARDGSSEPNPIYPPEQLNVSASIAATTCLYNIKSTLRPKREAPWVVEAPGDHIEGLSSGGIGLHIELGQKARHDAHHAQDAYHLQLRFHRHPFTVTVPMRCAVCWATLHPW